MSLFVWPITQSKEIENINLVEILYYGSDEASEIGDDYKAYESGNGQTKIPVKEQAEYLGIKVEILEYANDLSNIV